MLNEIRSLDELYTLFPDEKAAIDHFRALRWPNGMACVYCGSMERVYDLKMGKHKCGDCKEKFTVRHGTIFEDSKLPLRKWYAAIFLATSHKKGIECPTRQGSENHPKERVAYAPQNPGK